MANTPIVEVPKAPKKQFITYGKQIDKYNVKRSRNELTPAVCKVCGFDLGAHNKLGPYAEMDAETQATVRKAIERHISEFHNRADALIVDEDQMPKSYLSGKSMKTL